MLSEIKLLLVCPDDKKDLILKDSNLVCSNCQRIFEINENIIDLRPKVKKVLEFSDQIESNYDTYYDNLFVNTKKNKNTFGIISNSVPKGFVDETISQIKNHIKNTDIVCDIAAGSGDYSIPLAKVCKIMLHCDLDLEGIKISQKRANSENIKNIFFLITDYFSLPFKSKKMDLVYSIDVIERGEKHDKFLLEQIIKIVKNKGKILFDYHTSERKNITRQIPKEIGTYSKKEINELVKNFPLKKINSIGTGYLPQLRNWRNFEYKILNTILKKIKLPSARILLIYSIIDTKAKQINLS
jgi:ubiquinone/menaquinone biosynthesis C-methylase UbiE|tara:strand:- start:18156 stop:19049 length:894 start_codon:yes stop_codon:yes gene_type:complete